MNRLPRLREVFKLRNIALGMVITSPVIIWIARAKDKDGNPKPASYWQVKAYEVIPLRAVSRLWGSFNSITLPVWMRPYAFRFYAYLFGVNVREAADENLKNYANLGEFFYRELKPGARSIASSLLVCPSDGKVLQFGEILDNEYIEQVKGINYKVNRLLGSPNEAPHPLPHAVTHEEGGARDDVILQRHDKFAELNGLDYTLDDIMGDKENDNQLETENVGVAAVASASKVILPESSVWITGSPESNRLYYCVIYLAPGDYHRFHSPTNWVVSKRRHFVGELFSVAPYFQSRLTDLFCVNERVALLGKWKYGFFSMTPVGATNVGSIVINFDTKLKTNTRSKDKHKCFEASYSSASPFYRGYPLLRGEEMGGFKLGSTVVLVFEAPKNFEFNVRKGQVVKMGQKLGDLTVSDRNVD